MQSCWQALFALWDRLERAQIAHSSGCRWQDIIEAGEWKCPAAKDGVSGLSNVLAADCIRQLQSIEDRGPCLPCNLLLWVKDRLCSCLSFLQQQDLPWQGMQLCGVLQDPEPLVLVIRLCGCRLDTTADARDGAAAQAGVVGPQGKQPAYRLGRDLSAKLEHLYSLQQVGATWGCCKGLSAQVSL